MLELINHCNALTKDELDKALDNPTGQPPDLDAAARKALVSQAYRRLDAIYRTNEALRCTIFERALAIRNSAAVASYWSSFFGIGEPIYTPPSNSKDCLP
jgi:hypothetical protein